jgi:putative nucleotidyltransferase with HDIG domain
MDYCSFENPILMRLKTEAPGTFNHSLVVANLAEHCAFAIGKNPALARAAAYYHDVGKLKDPEYFIENQRDGRNPHDDLIPEVSVRKITIHTDEGYKLLTASNFPKIICDVAREHHGDSPLYSFYYKAQNITEGTLKYEQYRYRGPKPSSATAAIVMLADIVEAASRTKGSMDSNAISELVNNLVRDKIMNNQFDECDITMNELNIIKKTIVNVLPGIYHGRLSYPEKKS